MQFPAIWQLVRLDLGVDAVEVVVESHLVRKASLYMIPEHP